MSRVHDDNIPLSSAFESLFINDDVDTDIFGTPLGNHDDDTDPLIPKDEADIDTDDEHSGRYLGVAGAKRSLKKSTSDLTLNARERHLESSDHLLATTAVGRVKDKCTDKTLPSPGSARIHPPYNPPRRSSSNSRIESRSRYHDLAIDSAALRQQLTKQINHNGQTPLRPWRVRPARALNGPFRCIDQQNPKPSFKWFPRSKSDSASIPQVSEYAHKSPKKMPLKSSLRKSKSAATTPPGGSTAVPESPADNQPLRRVKTVDFEDAMSKNLISLPPLKPWSSEPSKANTPEEIQPTAQLQRKRGQRTQTVRRLPFCSNPSFKSTVADPAVTRTDVHVVAIAPCWNWEDGVDEGGIDAATPTMQMVESKSGCFEVVWDDVPIETDGRVRRRSSSASQALHTIGSTASRGLERVNSKLTEWTFGNRVVVFPDDDSCNDPSTYSLDSEEKAAVVPPPNSERTSAAQSRLPSRSTSVRQSRSVSNDDSNPKVVSPEDPDSWHKKVTSPEVVVTLAVPDPESLPPSLTSNGQRTSQAATLRRLSNIEDSEMKFRGHRDSVTLAHNRVPRTGGVSPELFMHRDSVSMAKKRMHARNHAVSEARIIPRRAPASAEPFLPDQDCSESIDMPLPPTVKEHATEALHSSISASMLRPQPTGSKRHIRIVE